MPLIQCTKCEEYKEEELFGDRIEKENGKRSECYACTEDRASAWRERNPDRVKVNKRVQYIRRRDLLTRKVGVDCEICRISFNLEIAVGAKNSDAPHWDHNHGTEQFRGWLCHNCNVLLGHAGDNPEILNRAEEYLRVKGCTPTRKVANK